VTESVSVPAEAVEHEPAYAATLDWTRPHSVTFADLALAQFARHRELLIEGREGRAAAEYRWHLAEFEREHGRIIESYWCRGAPAGVALTELPRRRAYGIRDDALVVAHFAPHPSVREVPQVAAMLSDCETLAFQASQILRGTSARIVLRWLLSVSGRLLDHVDRDSDDAKIDHAATEELVWRQNEEFRRVRRYYQRAALQASSMLHLSGILLGAVPLLLIAGIGLLLAWGFVPDHRSATAHEFLASYTMGVIGAVVSVILGMSTTKVALEEAGRLGVRWLGALRTVVGATFALVIYLAISGDLVDVAAITEDPSLQVFAVVAFFAGFSERWVKGLIARAVGAESEEPAASGPRSGLLDAPSLAPGERRSVRVESVERS
jgi:hypothetical protein